MRNPLFLGVAREIITPPIGSQLYGYTPDLFSESVNDDLTATAFVFRQGDLTSVLISATVGSVRMDLTEEILGKIVCETGIPRENCILHTTHTHSGPNVSGHVGWGEIDRKYCDEIFIPRILCAVHAALNNLVPVKVGIASGDSLVGINRRELNAKNQIQLGQNPWGPFNPVMTVISFADAQNKVVANLIHYGAHGTASGKNKETTRDWSGVMTDVLEEVSGGITAFINGPEGDVGPRLTNGRTVGSCSVRYAMELGGVAAQDAVRIYRNIHAYHQADLAVSAEEVHVPIKSRIPLEQARRAYEEFKNETVNIRAAKGNYYRSVIESYENGFEEQKSRSFLQTVIRIGDAAVISFPFELFSEIGMRIAKDSTVPYTLSLAIANGSEGYFVTQDQICRGGYEVDYFLTRHVQPYVDDADWHLVSGTLAHLRKMDEEKGE
ncbi:MAG: hypothetical protein E7662_04360 [Ruminococcaceae bacterium]|nr:hypothetical protein [Oscillospiraceae bacterium]